MCYLSIMEHNLALLQVGASFRYDAQSGKLVEKVYSPPGKDFRKEIRRGVVTGLSKRSAGRLIKTGLRGRPRAMLTLTYPAHFPDAKKAKGHLRAFLKRLFRRFPRIGILWRMEFQKRGAPHFHLLIQGVFAHSFLRVVAQRAWVGGTRRWGIKHDQPKASFLYGVRLDNLASGDGKETLYIAKYLSKPGFAPLCGRVWGKCRWREYYDWIYHVKHFAGARIYRLLAFITGEYGPTWRLSLWQYRKLRKLLSEPDSEAFETYSCYNYMWQDINQLEEDGNADTTEFQGDGFDEEAYRLERQKLEYHTDCLFRGHDGFIFPGWSGPGCCYGARSPRTR